MSKTNLKHAAEGEAHGPHAPATIPTQKIKIKDHEFSFASPYAEGHVLTANEALALNQTYSENLRNNFTPRLVKLLEKGAGPDEAQAEFVSYVGTYEFHGRRTATVVDPVGREARKIAKELVFRAIRKQGLDPKTISEEKIEANISKALATRPDIQKEAERIVAERKARAAETLEVEL